MDILTLAACALLGGCSQHSEPGSETFMAQLQSDKKSREGSSKQPGRIESNFSDSIAGNYLAARFAQNRHDWEAANRLYANMLAKSPKGDGRLHQRAMILSMGAGEHERALELAQQLTGDSEENSLPSLFLILGAIYDKDYQQAESHLDDINKDGIAKFIAPLLRGWTRAGLGQTPDDDALEANGVHRFHAVLMADYLDNSDYLENVTPKDILKTGISVDALEHIGDIYVRHDMPDQALAFYKHIQSENPTHTSIDGKITALESETANIAQKDLREPVNNPAQGAARALFDMASLLFRDYSDDSARLFTQMALYLKPDYTDARLLLAHIAARHGRIDDALGFYRTIGGNHQQYTHARQRMAGLLAEKGQFDRAVNVLRTLVEKKGHINAQIQIGDIHRRAEAFDKALASYNEAAAMIEGKPGREHWHLFYARGMVHERLNHWAKARADLEKALDYKPEHPYVLNYLGYSMADRGQNLDKALSMIRTAIKQRPEDGHIVDSLGWVLYRMQKYDSAVPHLEKAVELEPYDAVINDHLGDAYWRVGRRIEARFQWQRALNHSEKQSLKDEIRAKLDNGLSAEQDNPLKAAEYLQGE
jgi:tetratricopeptide (TPR) repeat protein